MVSKQSLGLLVAVASTLISSALADNVTFPRVTPCQEGGGPQHGCGKCVNGSSVAPVEVSKSNLTEFDNEMFLSQSGSGGGSTWFSVPSVPQGCKIIFFGETPGGMEPSHGTPGIIAGVASNEGCYFINTGDKLAVSYCCGDDQCNAVGGGIMSSQPPTKKHRRSAESPSLLTAVPAVRRSIPYKAVEEKRDAPRPNPVYTFFTPAATYSGSSNWVAPKVPQQWCEPAVQLPGSNDFYRAGFQQLTGNMQKCPSGFCSFSVDVTFTSGSSIDISSSVEDSEENGINYSTTFGYSLGLTILGTVGGDHQMTKAITNSTGFTNSTSHAVGITSTLGVQAGTWAQLLIVPQLSCKQLSSKCHNGTHTGEIRSELCTPVMSGADGKTPVYATYPVTLE